MKNVLLVLCSMMFALHGQAAVVVGKAAPEFSAKSSEGKEVKLSDYKGKIVVLEWFNEGCPFVKKHYESKNMQGLQKKYTGKGVVWLSVISSAKGKEGYSDAKKAEATRKKWNSSATAVLLDEKGTVGKLYGAEATPHMFVIDAKGNLAYQGAIDSIPSAEASDIKDSKNFVAMALDNVIAGKPANPDQTKAYGCSVKY